MGRHARAYKPTLTSKWFAITRIVPDAVCKAGPGNLPSRNHFHAVR